MAEKSGWKWSKQKHRAALLLAGDELTDAEISTELGIGPRTLYHWKKAPEFAAQVEALVKESGIRALQYAIAKKTRRVRNLDERLRRMQGVIEARAADELMERVPGGTTGLLVRSYKTVGSGESAEVVEEYAVDVALLREMRATEQQAAQELGQWVQKEELNVHGLPTKVYLGFDPREALGQPPTT